MKKYISKALALFFMAVSFSACLKDDSLVLDPDKGHNVIEFDNPSQIVSIGSIYPLYSFTFDAVQEMSLPITVSYSGPESGAPEDITVNVGLGSSAKIAEYNEDQDEHYELTNPVGYTLPTTSVVIKKGETKATFNVVFKPLAFTQPTSVLPLTITSSSSGIISGNFSTILLAVSAKNIYDGVYSVSGNIFRNSASGPDLSLGGNYNSGVTTNLVTLSQNSVRLTVQWKDGSNAGGVDGTSMTIDPATNLVTVKSSGNASLKNTVGKINSYDPATKTFTVAFDWGAAPSNRAVDMKLTYVGRRN